MQSVAWVMESSPASSFEMGEAEFALEFLIVAFDAPAQFGGIDEDFVRSILGQGREPVLGVGSRSSSGHSISSHSSGCGAVSLRVSRGGPYPHGGEARGQGLVGAPTPGHVSPGFFRQRRRQRLGRDRPMIMHRAARREGLASASAPGFGRQRLHARRPDADRRRHGHRIDQPHLCDAGAESAIGPVSGVRSERRRAPHPAMGAALICLSAISGLVLELHVVGDVSLRAPRRVIWPIPRADGGADTQSADWPDDWRSTASPRPGNCQSCRAVGNIVAPRPPNGCPSSRSPSRRQSKPRSGPASPSPARRVLAPWPTGSHPDQVDCPTKCRRATDVPPRRAMERPPMRSAPRLAPARHQQSRAIILQRSRPVHGAEHLRQTLDILDKTRFACSRLVIHPRRRDPDKTNNQEYQKSAPSEIWKNY